MPVDFNAINTQLLTAGAMTPAVELAMVDQALAKIYLAGQEYTIEERTKVNATYDKLIARKKELQSIILADQNAANGYDGFALLVFNPTS